MTHLRFFISCVSAKFANYRPALARALEAPYLSAKIQENFNAMGRATLVELDDYIRACDVVVHLVGDMTGARAMAPSVAAIARRYPDLGERLRPVAPFLAPGAPSLPYTQCEAWLALYHGRVLYVAEPTADAPGEGYRFVPSQRKIQQAHLRRLKRFERHTGIGFANGDQLVAGLLGPAIQELMARSAEALAGTGSNRGLSATQREFERIVEWFKSLYQGTPQQPVPFGGRTREIEAMNAWLEGRSEVGGRPLLAGRAASAHLLVHAPAGRGKTALLVRWMAQLGRDWAWVFVPVSIRAGSSEELVFYEALAVQLAAFLGDPLPAPTGDPVRHYRIQAAGFFARIGTGTRKCLVVVDGLDEARGWQLHASLLPLAESAALRIVVSARELAGDQGAVGWLRRLGWTPPHAEACRLQVMPLTRDGVADLLARMQLPGAALSQDVDIVDALYRLSDGADPLVLQFYANDLQSHGAEAARLKPEQLRQLTPGFAAYLRDWLSEQQEEWAKQGRAVDENLMDAILAVLACAHGPLTLADLERVAHRAVPGLGKFKAATVEPLRRFILGDGVHEGYVLAHPKLALVLQQEVFADAGYVAAARTAFTVWLRETVQSLNDGTLAPEKASAYALLFQVQHLAEGGAMSPLDAWAELMEPGWRKAWEARQGGHQGYARDLESVARALRDAADRDRDVLRRPRHGSAARCAARCCRARSAAPAWTRAVKCWPSSCAAARWHRGARCTWRSSNPTRTAPRPSPR